MLANLRYDFVDDVMVATLSGDVDMSNADEIGKALLHVLTNDLLALVLDFSQVDYFDSAGIHLLYDLRERLSTRGQRLRIVVPRASSVRDALELAGVLRSVEVDETLPEAQSALLRPA